MENSLQVFPTQKHQISPHIKNMVKIIEVCRVRPSEPAPPTTTLPLTFFDLLWVTSPSVQHLLFFSLPPTTSHLKHSLSLHHFFPLAGTLTWVHDKPAIHYSQGDSVQLTIAESNSDFEHLVSNHPRQAHTFHPLVPLLVPLDTTSTPLLAIQITIFPNHGVSVGLTIHHGVADGNTALNFLKSWARQHCKLSSLASSLDSTTTESVTSFDRAVIKDAKGLTETYLKDLERFGFFDEYHVKNAREMARVGVDSVRATYTFTRARIRSLNRRLSSLVEEKGMRAFYTSTYVVTCAYVLTCLLPARAVSRETIQIGFATGARTRLTHPIPAGYLGNCIGICWTSRLKTSEIKGEDGFVVAAEAFGSAIQSLTSVDDGVLSGAEEWVNDNLMALSDSYRDDDGMSSNERMMVAGSLKLNFYEIDFGWGRPKKSEVISLERKGTFSLGESGDGEGGVEIQLVFTSKHELDVFTSLFEEGLKALE